MKTKQPAPGDRLVFWNPNCEPERAGTVVSEEDGRFGKSWTVELDDEGIEHISGYVGTAKDIGGYYVLNQHAGIGAYLIAESPDEPSRSEDGECSSCGCMHDPSRSACP